jgi:hypothetical protein
VNSPDMAVVAEGLRKQFGDAVAFSDRAERNGL